MRAECGYHSNPKGGLGIVTRCGVSEGLAVQEKGRTTGPAFSHTALRERSANNAVSIPVAPVPDSHHYGGHPFSENGRLRPLSSRLIGLCFLRRKTGQALARPFRSFGLWQNLPPSGEVSCCARFAP